MRSAGPPLPELVRQLAGQARLEKRPHPVIRAQQVDHAIPYPRGSTSAALCRRHHRLKTHAGWDLLRTDDGHTLWTSPAGHTVLRRPFNYLRYLS